MLTHPQRHLLQAVVAKLAPGVYGAPKLVDEDAVMVVLHQMFDPATPLLLLKDGVFAAFNPAFTERFGYPIEELVGHTPGAVIAGPFTPIPDDYLLHQRVLTVLHKDGTLIPQLFTRLTIGIGDSIFHVGVCTAP